jgi:hypothetical protein
MKKLVLLMAILALCAPCFGSVLVYKVTTTVDPAIVFANTDANQGDVSKSKLDTFVVFEVNDTTFDVIIPADIADVNDPNIVTRSANRPTAIVTGTFGKTKFQMVEGGSDANSTVAISTEAAENSIKAFANTTKGKAADVTLLFISVSDEDTSLDISAELFGNNTSADIGAATKLSLAKSLKGINELAQKASFLVAFGPATATIDVKATKNANVNGLSVADTAAAIQAGLTQKKFTVVTELPL